MHHAHRAGLVRGGKEVVEGQGGPQAGPPLQEAVREGGADVERGGRGRGQQEGQAAGGAQEEKEAGEGLGKGKVSRPVE